MRFLRLFQKAPVRNPADLGELEEGLMMQDEPAFKANDLNDGEPTSSKPKDETTEPSKCNTRGKMAVAASVGALAALAAVEAVSYFTKSNEPSDDDKRSIEVYYGNSTFYSSFINASSHRPGGVMMLPLVAKWSCDAVLNNSAAIWGLWAIMATFSRETYCGYYVNTFLNEMPSNETMAIERHCVNQTASLSVQQLQEVCANSSYPVGRIFSDLWGTSKATIDGFDMGPNETEGAPAIELAVNLTHS